MPVDEVVDGDLIHAGSGDQIVADGVDRARRARRARRVGPDGRVALGGPGGGRRGPLRVVRRRGLGGLRRERGGRGQLRRADRRRRACVPSSALADGARAQRAADRARPGDGAARHRPRDRAGRAGGRQRAGDGVDGRRGARDPRPRRADAARQPDRGGRGDPDGATRRARAAAQRRRVARVGRRDVPGQDRHAHAGGAARRAARPGRGRRARPSWRMRSSRLAAATGDANRTMQALAQAFPAAAIEPVAEVAFTSRRRWSAVELDGREPAARRARALRPGLAGGRPAGRDRRGPARRRASRARRRASRSRRPTTGRRGRRAHARPRGARRAAARRRARDRRVPARAGRRAADPVRRRARHRRGDRARRGGRARGPRDRRERASRGRRRPRRAARADVGRRPRPAGGQAADRRGARRAGSLRRDGGRRRERRPGAEGGPARDRPGHRSADGQERRRRGARPGRLRRGAADGRRGPDDPAQRPARRAAVRDEVGLRRGDDRRVRGRRVRLPVHPAAAQPRRDADDRRARVLPRARAERGRVAARRPACGASGASRCPPGWRSRRGARLVRDRDRRLRLRDGGGAHRRDDDARRGRPGLRRRARGRPAAIAGGRARRC